MQALGVYIHIPFCVQKCVYCDFLSAPATKEKQRAYLEALKKEIEKEAKGYTDYVIETVFFGGGTPSVLSSVNMHRIITAIKANFYLSNEFATTYCSIISAAIPTNSLQGRFL